MNEVLIGFVVAFLVWMATDWPFTYVLLGVGLAWLLLFRNGGSMGSGVGSWITSTVKGIFGTTLRLTVGVVIFIGLMMLVNKLASNSPYWISRRFQTLGWDVWNWPANIGLPLLFFVCTTILAGWVAKRAATGDAQIAGWIFGISAVVIFTMWWFPRTTEVVRPKPVGKTGPLKPGETQAWADADQAVAESGGGPTAFCIGWKAVLGPRWPCSDTTIMGAVRGMLPSPAGSRTYTPAPAPAAPIAECDLPCSMPVGWGTKMRSDRRPFLVKYYGKVDWYALSGREDQTVPLDKFAPGLAEFTADPADPDRTPVTVRIYPAR